jgi:hypothetical protein
MLVLSSASSTDATNHTNLSVPCCIAFYPQMTTLQQLMHEPGFAAGFDATDTTNEQEHFLAVVSLQVASGLLYLKQHGIVMTRITASDVYAATISKPACASGSLEQDSNSKSLHVHNVQDVRDVCVKIGGGFSSARMSQAVCGKACSENACVCTERCMGMFMADMAKLLQTCLGDSEVGFTVHAIRFQSTTQLLNSNGSRQASTKTASSSKL